MKNKFIDAYCYCYGETKKRAKEVYKTASKQYIRAVIESWENDCQNSWLED